jgi:hypothetical protein
MPKPDPNLEPFERPRWRAGGLPPLPPARPPAPRLRAASPRATPSAQYPAPSTASLSPPQGKRRVSTPQPPRRRLAQTSSLTRPQACPSF